MKIKTILDYQVILANQARPVCFAVRFDAPEIALPRPRPAAFCIVLDRSGSMEGAPLEKAKAASKLAVRNLRPEDHFSLVVFDQEAQVVVPLQKSGSKEQMLKAIDGIFSRGSTNLTSGWSLGRDELKKAPEDCSRRLLLLSDGHLNHGITQPEAVRGIVTAGLERAKIRTSCLGFGSGYNEDLMTALAQATSGQFYDADSEECFPAIFEAELQGLQKLAVQNLRLRIKPLDFCESIQPLGNSPALALPDGRVEYAVGDLMSGETRILCFQVQVLPLPCVEGRPVASLEGERLLEAEALWDEVGESQLSSSVFLQLVRIQATQDPADIKVQNEVVPWVALQRAGAVLEQASEKMDKGEENAALAILQQSIEALRMYGDATHTGEAIRQLEMMAEAIKQARYSLRERKVSRYKSHSYRRMSSSEMWTSSEPPPDFKKPSQGTAQGEQGSA